MVSKALYAATLTAAGIVCTMASSAPADTVTSRQSTKPNIVFILTDDQDVEMGSLEYMPLLKKHIADQGATFNHHYCQVSLCCPSRVTLLTGKSAHNTNVTDVQPPYGGYTRFVDQGLNDDYLPIWLQEAGYKTYYTGKLFNYHTIGNYRCPAAAGWDRNSFLLDPGQYLYKNPIVQNDQDPPKWLIDTYVTDLISSKSLEFLDDAAASDKPFFLTVAPNACHAEVTASINQGGVTVQLDGNNPIINNLLLNSVANQSCNGSTTPVATSTSADPVAALRHADLFPNLKVPRTPNFNPDELSSASWIRDLPQLNATQVAYNDEWYRKRIQALQAVDEMVDAIFAKLEANGQLDNTYIFYSADNGFHVSQHRLPPGKVCNIEEDIHVPLMVRGPGIAPGSSFDFPTNHADIVPTFFALAGIPLHDDFDGNAIPLTSADALVSAKTEHVLSEFWDTRISFEGSAVYPVPNTTIDNTYKSLRIIGEGYNLLYTVWCNGQYELYDMTVDQYQMQNLLASGFPSSTNTTATAFSNTTVSLYTLATRLDGLLFVVKSCAGASCREPWKALDPSGSISTISDALSSEYDDYFENELPRVYFSECEPGYILSAEGLQFGEEYVYSANATVKRVYMGVN